MSLNIRFYLSYDIKSTLKSHCCRKTLLLCHYVRNVVMDVIKFPEICKRLVVYRFYCMLLFHSQTRRYMINIYIHVVESNIHVWPDTVIC